MKKIFLSLLICLEISGNATASVKHDEGEGRSGALRFAPAQEKFDLELTLNGELFQAKQITPAQRSGSLPVTLFAHNNSKKTLTIFFEDDSPDIDSGEQFKTLDFFYMENQGAAIAATAQAKL